MKPLPEPHRHHLRAAERWMELGNHLEANLELEMTAPVRRAHPDVLKLRWAICAKVEKWDVCTDIVRAPVGLP